MLKAIKKFFSAEVEAPEQPLPTRNEKCHCGSERKYKHCCMAKDKRKGRG